MFDSILRRQPKTGANAVQEIIEGIKINRCPTLDAIRLLLNDREAAVPTLTAILEEAVRWKRLPTGRSDAPMHVIFLLAALEAPEGFDPLVRLLRKPSGFVEEFLGDIMTECLPWALARLAKHNPEGIVSLAQDSFLDPFLRSAAVRGLVAQGWLWPERRPLVISRCAELLEKAVDDPDPEWPSLLVADVMDLAAPELQEKIERLFEQDLIDEQCVTRDEVEQAYRRPRPSQEETSELMDVFNLYKTYRFLIAWQDPDVMAEREAQERRDESRDTHESLPDEETVNRPPSMKVERNRRCPCGSGLKYKKCCLEAPHETVLERILATIGSATTIEQLKAQIMTAIESEALVKPSQIIQQALRGAPGDPSDQEVAFDSTEQANVFLAHFQALWNALAGQRRNNKSSLYN